MMVMLYKMSNLKVLIKVNLTERRGHKVPI